jgi:hypothetical protein
MSRITTKWITDNAVTDQKILLRNNQYLRGRNAGDTADIDIAKVNASNQIELASVPVVGGVALALVNDIPSVFAIQGNWDADTNSPALADGVNSTGDDYPLYIVNVAGATELDGTDTWQVGDWVYYANGQWWRADNLDDVVSVNGQSGVVVLDTDDISEGSNLYYTQGRFDTAFAAKSTTDLAEGSNLYYTAARFNTAFSGKSTTDLAEGSNLYHTTARARTAAVVDSTAGDETDQAPSVSAIKDYIASQIAGSNQSFGQETFTLDGTDISNGYVTLAETPIADSIHVTPKGGLPQEPGVDFTITGAQLDFAGDLATLLADGDKLIVHYAY